MEATNEEDLVEQELGIQKILDEQDKLRETVASGMKKSWSFETLAIQAGLYKDDNPTATQLWLNAAVAATFTDVVDPVEIPTAVDEDAVNYSQESLATIGVKILKLAIEYLKKLFAATQDLLRRVSDFCFGLESRLERLQKRAKRLGHLLVGDQGIPLGQDAYRLAVMGGIPLDATSLESHLDALLKHLVALRSYVKALPNIGNKLASAIKGFDWEKQDESLDDVRVAACSVFDTELAKMCRIPVNKDVRFNIGKNDSVKASAPLLGNMSVFHLDANSDGNALERLRASRRSKLQLLNTTQSTRVFETPQTFKPFTAKQTEDVLGKAKLVLAELKLLNDDSVKNDYKRAMDALTSAIGSFTKPEDGKNSVYEAVTEFTGSFADWGTKPHESMSSHSASVIRAVLGLCSKNLDALR